MSRRLRRNITQTKSCDLTLVPRNFESDDLDSDNDNYPRETAIEKCPKPISNTSANYDCENVIKIKKSSSKCVTFIKKTSRDAEDLALRRQHLEIMLSSRQVDEATAMEKHKLLQARFERIENILEALVHYIDCIKLELRSSYRLCQLFNNFIVNENGVIMTENLSQTIKRLCENQQFDYHSSVKSKVLSSLDSTKNLETLYENFHDRKRDYNTGIINFKLLLEGMTLNASELDNLQKQFDDVLVNFQHSRCLLDQELPCYINLRLQTLADCLIELRPDLEQICCVRVDMTTLFKNIELIIKNLNDFDGSGNHCQIDGKCKCSCSSVDLQSLE